MVRRMMILVLGLCLIEGGGQAQAQEATRRAGGQVGRTTRTTVYADWQAVGTRGAVAAGGRDAVAAGLGILNTAREHRGCSGRDDPGLERDRLPVVLLRRRGTNPGL